MAWYHQITAKILEKFPGIYEWLTLKNASEIPDGLPDSPFESFEGDPFQQKVMLVTTGGVHTPVQEPFDMSDSRGDTSYRLIPSNQEKFTITHDYYDHSDADDDLNCLFPLPLARNFSNNGLIGPLADQHVSFMGHIEDPLLPDFINKSMPQLWENLADRPDLILLSPG